MAPPTETGTIEFLNRVKSARQAAAPADPSLCAASTIGADSIFGGDFDSATATEGAKNFVASFHNVLQGGAKRTPQMDSVLAGYLNCYADRCHKPQAQESKTAKKLVNWCLTAPEGRGFFPWWLTPLLGDPTNDRELAVMEDGTLNNMVAPHILFDALRTVTKGDAVADQYMPKGTDDRPLYQYMDQPAFCNETQAAFGRSAVAFMTMVLGKKIRLGSAAGSAAETTAGSIYGPMPTVKEDDGADMDEMTAKNVIAAVPKRIELLGIWGLSESF